MKFRNFCPMAACNACGAEKNQSGKNTEPKFGPCRNRRKELIKLTKLQTSSEIRIVEYILDHLYKSSDLFLGRQTKVVRHTGCSKAQVFKVFRALQEDGLMVKLTIQFGRSARRCWIWRRSEGGDEDVMEYSAA